MSDATTKPSIARRHRVRMFLAWFVALALLGYLLAFPLASGIALAEHFVARATGSASPYEGDSGDAVASGIILIGAGSPLFVAGIAISLWTRRRGALRRWRAVAFWLATVVILLAPATAFHFGEFTVKEMLGKGILW